MNIHITFFIAISLLLPIFVGIYITTTVLGVSSAKQTAIPDLSGIAWVQNDTFLAIHDAKYPDEADEPRASLLTLPSHLGGTVNTPLNVTWEQGEAPGSDLECIARIPDTNQTDNQPQFLLGESGDNDRGSKRVLLSQLDNDSLIVTDNITWPIDIYNVEGCALTVINNELVFLFAERAQGSQNTTINWASLSLNPLSFGEVNSVEYNAFLKDDQEVDPGFRPISAIEIDNAGKILVASAIDPDVDTGPFTSDVWFAGYINSNETSISSPISLLNSPEQLASLDGLKVEALSTRPINNGSDTEIIIGTDDEYSGGVLRVLP